jgi:hypothetical protein
MLKILFVMGLFNIHTQTLSNDYKVVGVYKDWQKCALAINHTGPQKPDKEGNVKVYECVLQGDQPTGQVVQR